MFPCADAITVALISSLSYKIINAIVVVAIVVVIVKFLLAVCSIHYFCKRICSYKPKTMTYTVSFVYLAFMYVPIGGSKMLVGVKIVLCHKCNQVTWFVTMHCSEFSVDYIQ